MDGLLGSKYNGARENDKKKYLSGEELKSEFFNRQKNFDTYNNEDDNSSFVTYHNRPIGISSKISPNNYGPFGFEFDDKYTPNISNPNPNPNLNLFIFDKNIDNSNNNNSNNKCNIDDYIKETIIGAMKEKACILTESSIKEHLDQISKDFLINKQFVNFCEFIDKYYNLLSYNNVNNLFSQLLVSHSTILELKGDDLTKILNTIEKLVTKFFDMHRILDQVQVPEKLSQDNLNIFINFIAQFSVDLSMYNNYNFIKMHDFDIITYLDKTLIIPNENHLIEQFISLCTNEQLTKIINDKKNNTLLKIIVDKKYNLCRQILQCENIDVNVSDFYGKTLAMLVLEESLSPENKQTCGTSLLSLSPCKKTISGSINISTTSVTPAELFDLLIEYPGIDLNARDHLGNTLLSIAIKHRNLDIIETLVVDHNINIINIDMCDSNLVLELLKLKYYKNCNEIEKPPMCSEKLYGEEKQNWNDGLDYEKNTFYETMGHQDKYSNQQISPYCLYKMSNFRNAPCGNETFDKNFLNFGPFNTSPDDALYNPQYGPFPFASSPRSLDPYAFTNSTNTSMKGLFNERGTANVPETITNNPSCKPKQINSSYIDRNDINVHQIDVIINKLISRLTININRDNLINENIISEIYINCDVYMYNLFERYNLLDKTYIKKCLNKLVTYRDSLEKDMHQYIDITTRDNMIKQKLLRSKMRKLINNGDDNNNVDNNNDNREDNGEDNGNDGGDSSLSDCVKVSNPFTSPRTSPYLDHKFSKRQNKYS